MSYFNTLNEFLDNANEAKSHMDDFKDSIVSSKVSDIKDKFDQAIEKVENYGQAVIGASTAYHLGRKVYKKIKGGKDPNKDEKKKEEEPEEQEEAPEEEPHAPTSEGNFQEFNNPAFEAGSLDESGAPSGIGEESQLPSGTEPELSADIPSEPVTAPTAEAEVPFPESAREIPGFDLSTTDIPRATRIEPEPSLGQAPLVEQETGGFRPATSATRDASEALDGSDAMASQSTRVLEDAGESTAKDFVEKAGEKLATKVGTKIAEKVGFDIAGATLDAIPVIGEIAGVAQIFHGLFKEHKERALEAKKEAKASTGIRIAGGIVSGGADISALASGYAPIAGLV